MQGFIPSIQILTKIIFSPAHSTFHISQHTIFSRWRQEKSLFSFVLMKIVSSILRLEVLLIPQAVYVYVLLTPLLQ